ncbi:MAG: hypothetical protein JO119_10170 [Acidobacteria bacterium]|nr:hypothetical protein [Acidobacteriota bacterium]
MRPKNLRAVTVKQQCKALAATFAGVAKQIIIRNEPKMWNESHRSA